MKVILTGAVLLYQLFFVAAMYVASRFGRVPLNIALVLALLWTATHVFLPPLAALQATVILSSYFVFRRRHQTSKATESDASLP